MNFVFVSPNFPVRYFKWVEALRDHGVTVLGIGDSPYFDVHPRLKEALTEYYFVADLGDAVAMEKACQYFEKKYGHLDFIESDNEWWLEGDAVLREKFDVATGFWPRDMKKIKAKSAMKEFFRQGGVKTMRYLVVAGPKDKAKAVRFQKKVGWPLFVKPDIGVGAADSYAIHNQKEFDTFFSRTLSEPYIMEEFVDGFIASFDGICDSQSDVVFCTSDHFMTPIATVVNELSDYYYYNNPFALPFADLDQVAFEKAGRAVVKAFGIKQRFFHIEFFVLNTDKEGLAKKGEFVALECNMRPAGGYTPDLINYANSVSCYQIYADVISYDENRQDMSKMKYYAFASARRDGLKYAHTDQEILTKFHDSICMYGRYPAHMAPAMGDLYYYGRFEKYDDGMKFDTYVREKITEKK